MPDGIENAGPSLVEDPSDEQDSEPRGASGGPRGVDAKCFVIAPIGSEDSDLRRHSEKVLKYIIRPGLERLHQMGGPALEPLIGHQIASNDLITHTMFREILEDPLCIAILTGANANVLYEVAIAQCAARPLVLMIDQEEVPVFDVRDHRALRYDLDAEAAERASVRLAELAHDALEEPRNPLEAYGFPVLGGGVPRPPAGFDQVVREVDKEFQRAGVYWLWHDEPDDVDIASREYLLQLGLQKLVYAASVISSVAVESANLWVCHSVDERGRAASLRSGHGHGYFPFRQLVDGVKAKKRVYVRPVEVEYDNPNAGLLVAGQVVASGVPEVQLVESASADSSTEEELGTKEILGIPVGAQHGARGVRVGQPMCVTVDFRASLGVDERRRVIERATALQPLLGRLVEWASAEL